MDSEKDRFQTRIILVGVFFSLLFFIIELRVIYLQFFCDKNLSMVDSQLRVTRNDLVAEGARLEHIIGNLENMSLKDIQIEIRKTKTYLLKLQEKTEKEINYLNELRLLSQETESQVENLEKQRQAIEKLNDKEVEFLVSIMASEKFKQIGQITTFVMGVLTSLIGSCLFHFRDKIGKEFRMICKVVIETIKRKVSGLRSSCF